MDLENHLNRHPKRTTDAIPSEGSRGFTILKCRLSELNAVVNNVKQSVDNTTSRPPTPVGYMTYEVHQKLNWALTFPPTVFFITLGGSIGSDSGITAWAQHMNVQTSLKTLTSQFVPLFIKAAFVAIWPTIAAHVLVAKKKIET